MPVQKIVIESVVLIEADTPEAARTIIEGMEPSAVVEMCDTSEAVGTFEIKSVVRVPRDRIDEECRALGSDGSFFADVLAEGYLATGEVYFLVVATSEHEARISAQSELTEFVEEDDLIGEGSIVTIDRYMNGQWRVCAKVLFRTQGADIEEARTFASTRLAEVVRTTSLLADGKVVSVEDDQA